jgi:Zn finger protein HypA/HybF involved in hydrogenase expression
MNEIRQFDSTGFRCKRCGYEWQSKKPIKPAECPQCRSSLWNVQDVRSVYSIDEAPFPVTRYIMRSSPRVF